MIIRKEVQKSDLLKLMSKIEEGKHESITGVEMIPVTAFRLIPQAKLYIPSTLNIDFILWHTQLIVCAENVKSWFKSWFKS